MNCGRSMPNMCTHFPGREEEEGEFGGGDSSTAFVVSASIHLQTPHICVRFFCVQLGEVCDVREKEKKPI